MSNSLLQAPADFPASLLESEFANPPREFTLIPFWFWNDELSEAEIVRQLDDFEARGVYGFVIHPRVGLPRHLGWMSEGLLRFVRFAVAEAARRDMKVILYDEGMYPSGSSCGQVVGENPAFAVRGLDYFWADSGQELGENEHLVATVPTRDGRRVTVYDRAVDSVIRGIHFIGEGPEEDTPPAADLLNPEAMQCFIRLSYDRYYEALKEYFGSTVIGMFTDEPAFLGRLRERKKLGAGTTGIVDWVSAHLGYDFRPHLPSLWFDDEPEAAKHRAAYMDALHVRLEETYYAPLHDWCVAHGVALMGHPEDPDQIGLERYFHVPGQDVVWRWVLPGESALEGPQSTQGKCSSSAMVHGGRRRNSNECLGAYGHELTFEEVRWVTNWLLVRGVNMLIPHAFYYSVRGPRWDERPPDVGPNSAWWDDFGAYAGYCRRLCWLNTDSVHRCSIAILSESDHLTWSAAKVLFENQLDFNYLEARELAKSEISEDGVRTAGMHYRALVLDGLQEIPKALLPLMDAGRVLNARQLEADELVAKLEELTPATVRCVPASRDLRIRQVVKGGREFCLLFNEGTAGAEFEIETGLEDLEVWDAWTGEVRAMESRKVRLEAFGTLLFSTS